MQFCSHLTQQVYLNFVKIHKEYIPNGKTNDESSTNKSKGIVPSW